MKKIFMSLLIVLCCVITTACGSSEKELLEAVKEEELGAKFFETQTLENMEIRNFNIVSEDSSYLAFDVVNMSEGVVNIEFIKVLLFDVDDNLILETYGYVGNLQPSETKNVGIDVEGNLSSVTKVSYERM